MPTTPLKTPGDRWTLVDALRRHRGQPGRPAVCEFLDGRTLSFEQLDAESDALATAFADEGLGPGDRIALFAGNHPEFLVAMFAAHKRRATVIPLNVELKGALLEHQLRQSRPRALIVDDHLLDRLNDLGDGWAQARTVIVIGDDAPRDVGPRLSDLAEATPDATAILDPEPSDTAAILHTSGTTGPAKGVVLPHAHCFLFGALQARAHQLTAADRFFVALPLFHVNALFMAFGSCLITGADAVFSRRFSATSWLDEIRQVGATVTNVVGVMADFVLKQPETPNDCDHRLRSVMAIPVGETWASSFETRFGVRLVQVYGMTECNIVSFSDPTDPLEPGCTGPVLSEFFDVSIVDPSTEVRQPPGEVGEIVVRPLHPWAFMQGYFELPQETLSSWRNLWFHTGDAGYLDERGRLHFVDRLKDCIRRRGENVSAFEVEQVLTTHPAVLEAAVVGVPAADGGGEEEVMAFAVSRGSLNEKELHDWLEPRLPRFAVPRFIDLVPELEKTATGKIRKESLRELGVTASAVDCLAAKSS